MYQALLDERALLENMREQSDATVADAADGDGAGGKKGKKGKRPLEEKSRDELHRELEAASSRVKSLKNANDIAKQTVRAQATCTGRVTALCTG